MNKELQELELRNKLRLQEAKEKLGTKWLLHPSNQIKRKDSK